VGFNTAGDGSPESGSVLTFGFTGELQDDQGIVYLRARWYNAAHGAFTGCDPFAGIAERPYSLNPYQYAYSNPVLWSDPSGSRVDLGVILGESGNASVLPVGGTIGVEIVFDRKRIIKILNIILLIILLDTLLSCSSEDVSAIHARFPDDRRHVAGQRGSRILALRRPKRMNDPDTQIIFVHTDGHADNDNLHGSNKTVQLPSSIRLSLEHLKYNWCVKAPIFGPIRDDILYYSLAFDCGPVGEQILIPEDKIPPELQDLLDIFDKP
jgi:RHS repeat-associated protein